MTLPFGFICFPVIECRFGYVLYLMFIFFACPKKTNQKKGHPCLLPAFSGFPVFLKAAGSLKTRPLCGLKQFKLLIGIFSGTRRRANGEKP